MIWRDLFADEIINDALEYIQNHQFRDLEVADDELKVTMLGKKEYDVRILYKGGSITEMLCTCPYGASGVRCEHMAAACIMGEAKSRIHDAKVGGQETGGDVQPDAVRTTQLVSESKGCFSVSAEVNDYYCYALQQNGGIPLVKNVVLRNESEEDLEDAILMIETDTEMIEPFVRELEVIPAGGMGKVQEVGIAVHGNFLAAVEETLKCNLGIKIVKDGEELVAAYCEITVLPYNQWPGNRRYSPELLAAFVLPSHPEVKVALKRASALLKEWTGDDALAGYQYKDKKRVILIAKAIYSAIQEKNVSYLSAPPSFEDDGQKVRFPDEIMEFRMGTCMDMTLFYLACLEGAGLNGVYVLINGHIFSGVWLTEEGNFGGFCTFDGSKLLKLSAEGINDLLLIDAVKMCGNLTFEEAVAKGREHLEKPDDFECAGDVARARISGVKPIPYRIRKSDGYSLVFEDRDMTVLKGRDTIDFSVTDISDVESRKTKVTKLTQWERRLLDISTRNLLVSAKEKRLITFMASSIGKVEDALSDESEFVIAPILEEATQHLKGKGRGRYAGRLEMGFEKDPFTDKYAALLDRDVEAHVLHTYFMDEVSLRRDLRKLYNDNNSMIEETGTNVMYLTLGMLKWVDDAKGKKVNYSPIILVPAEIINKSASKGYTIRKRDSDTVINMTMLEMLKEQFGIEISGLDVLPEDDHGVDVGKVFAVIRKAIMNKEGWDVVDCCAVGNFSFGQIVMWDDVHSHPEFLENNKVVKSLISGVTEWGTAIPEIVDRDEPYLPVSVDASQMRAVNMAANGVSFILQGPPGTGKSQTITAMIANALMKEKKVLFVAEKQAALDVVHGRLRDIGLDNFCLEIYSNKATKRSVLNQIAKNMSLKNLGMHTEYEEKLDEIKKRKEELDEYARVLHTPQKCGLSLRQLIDGFEAMDESGPRIRIPDEFLDDCDAGKMQESQRLLEELVVQGRRLGHPRDCAFSYVGVGEYSQTLRKNLECDLDACFDDAGKLRDAAEKAAEAMSAGMPASYQEWMWLLDFARALLDAGDMPKFLIEAPSIEAAFAAPKEYLSARADYESYRAGALSRWKEEFFKLDPAELERRHETASGKFFGKHKALEELCNEINAYSVSGEKVEDALQAAGIIREYERRAEQLRIQSENLPLEWKELMGDEPSADRLNLIRAQAEEKREAAGEFLDQIREMQESRKGDTAAEGARNLLSAFEEFRSAEKKLDELLDMPAYNPNEKWLETKQARWKEIEAGTSALRDWIGYRAVEAKCIAEGLEAICEAYREGMGHDDLIPSFLRSLYKALIWRAIENSPAADKFTGSSFNERIAEFKKADDEFIDVTREEIVYQLRLRTPSARSAVERSINGKVIAKAIKSGGRGTTIRELFEQTFDSICTCCPCMLMSPLSVAQYLPPKNDLFDVVIFDEASQLPTSKAVGVIARGKSAVIVGDPKQMPPTNFFAGKYEDMENYDLEDLESILDDCEVIGMPNTSLRWHYRSRHESLIAFSNRNYYGNGMFTFPSVNDGERRVTLVKVNGRKKGNVNEREARRIVDDVLHRYHDEKLKKKSFGIVTFNISQCEYVKKLLLEEYAKDPEFEVWATGGEEPLFVKNLENVQGDERDVILFSVTFGPDEEGRLSINFGPLNKDGGWRRLNVAVSRAKHEMVIFSSMTSLMIEQKHPSSEGAKGLAAFLKYAETGVLPETEEERTEQAGESGIKKKVCEAIEKAGYRVRTDLGHSEFKIDVAVVSPNNPDEYLLGIMFDGESYRMAGNTRDREIAQGSVLKGLGWNLRRLWTMDWWDDSEREINGILEELESLKAQAADKKEEHWYPESEEIVYEEPGPRKRKTESNKNKCWVEITKERFNPAMPHTASQEELRDSEILRSTAELLKKHEVIEKRKG